MPKRRILATLDCETDPFKIGRFPDPFIWGLYYKFRNKEIYQEFTETISVINFLRDFPGLVYAHNGGKFDYFFMVKEYFKMGYYEREKYLQTLLINGRLSKWFIGECELRDSMNILPVPLKAFNKDDFDYTKLEKEVRHKHIEEIKAYLRNDCKYLYDAVLRFTKTYGRKLTTASAGMSEWKKLADFIPRSGENYFDDLKPYYNGGRVSCFEKGIIKGKFKCYDIKSAYPFAMLHNHPYGTKYFTSGGRFFQEKHLERSFLTIKCNSRGAFPQRKKDGSIHYPHGHGTFLVTGWEFKAALKTNTMTRHKILEAKVFESTTNFVPYVEKFYAEKLACEKSGDKYGRVIAKLLLNSLYGKFGQDCRHFEDTVIAPFMGEVPEGYLPGNIIDNFQIYNKPRDEEKDLKFFNVATSASITGFVRAYLWEAIQTVKRPLYSDTDCIFCEDGPELDMGDKLGQWELEGEFHTLAIAGKKLYAAFGDKIEKTASKGLRLTAKEILKVAGGESVTYKSEAPTYSMKKAPSFLERVARCT